MNFENLVTAAHVVGKQVEQMRWALLDAEVRAESAEEILNLRAALDDLRARHQQVESVILG